MDGCMNQKLWSSLTTALLVAAFGSVSSQAAHARAVATGSEANISPAQNFGTGETASLPSTPAGAIAQVQYQFQGSPALDAAIAKIYPHVMEGRAAATLHVHNIPVLTFLGSEVEASGRAPSVAIGKTQRGKIGGGKNAPVQTAQQYSENDPIARASAIAAYIEQLNRDGTDASTITVSPDSQGDRFTIQINGQDLVAIDGDTILPDTTGNLAEDALQATNRLRRLLGNAPPLAEIPGFTRLAYAPRSAATDTAPTGPVLLSYNGWASWYGPGFHGNASASGEIFNQNDLTAAHLELPFGTRVRVTNLDNGRSVIVRINDRGPFSGGRIIDLSAAAAESIGMMDSGVAPVRVDVLGAEDPARIGSQPW